MENKTFKYYAFISYKREDEKWAKWLQQRLEHYKFPVDIRKKHTDTPPFLRPIFRDKTDLNGPILKSSINSALDDSKYLIVVCSPNASMSEWVNKEIEYFIATRDIKYIIPFIIGGSPNASNPQIECFPSAIRNLSKDNELLGINIQDTGKESALVRTISRLTNISYDILWQRYHRSQKRRKNIIMAITLLIAVIMSIFTFALSQQNRLIQSKNTQLLINQSIAVSDVANRLLANGDTFTAAKLALEVMPSDILNPDRPYTSQAELALRNATSINGGLFCGHTGRVYRANTSQDGKLLVSTSCDKTVKIWDATSGECLRTINSEEENPRGVEISSDNRAVFSYGLSDTIRVWNVHDGNCIQTINCSTFGNLMGARFTEDNNRIISSIDNYIVEWDIYTGEHQIIRDDIPVKDIDTSLTSARLGEKYIVIGSNLSQNLIYDLENSKIYCSTFIRSGCMFMSRDEKLVIIIENNFMKNYSSIYIYDIDDGHLIKEIKSNKTFSLGDISPDNKHIVTGSDTIIYGTKNDTSIDVWDIETGIAVQSFKGHHIENISFSHDGKHIISSAINGDVGLWAVSHTNLHYEQADIGFNNSGNQFAYSKGNTVYVYDIDSKEIIQTFCIDINSYTYGNTERHIHNYFTEDNRYLLCGLTIFSFSIEKIYKTIFFVCDIINGTYREVICKYPNTETIVYDLKDIQATSDNKYLITTTSPRYQYNDKGWKIGTPDIDGCHRMDIIDFETGEQLHALVGHTNTITNTIISKDNKQVISVSKDGSIRYWDIETGECTKILQDDSSFKFSDVTKDKKYIYTLSNDNTISRWSIESGEKFNIGLSTNESYSLTISNLSELILIKSSNSISVLSAKTGETLYTINIEDCVDMDISYDDRYIITKGSFGDILVFNSHDGGLIWQLHYNSINNVFNPFRNEFIDIIGDTITTTKIVPIQQLIEETKQRLSHRKLTKEERKKYYLE